jgi:hypothetical protein
MSSKTNNDTNTKDSTTNNDTNTKDSTSTKFMDYIIKYNNETDRMLELALFTIISIIFRIFITLFQIFILWGVISFAIFIALFIIAHSYIFLNCIYEAYETYIYIFLNFIYAIYIY